MIGIGHPGRGAMHLKLAVCDGKKVETGSFNWESGSSQENHENMILSGDRELVSAYADHFAELVGGVEKEQRHASDLATDSAAFFGYRHNNLADRVGQLIDGATRSIHVAMFTAKRDEDNGALTRMFAKLIAAKRRGVDVTMVFDAHIAEPFVYFGRQSGDDQTDEWLESNGIKVVRADNRISPVASMHHKFMVVDATTTVTGAFNWYWDANFINDEDIVVLRDRKLAAQYIGELTDLLRRYDPTVDGSRFAQSKVEFDATCDGTSMGDSLLVVGELPQAGGWDPARAIKLEGTAFPRWRGSVTLPAGVRLDYKLAIRRADGRVDWEAGANRRVAAPSDGSPSRTADAFRR